MASFRPYVRPTNQVPVITRTSPRVHVQEGTDVVRGIPKINYMERVLDSGKIIRLRVVDENAARALMANGFKRCYPAPGEEATLPTSPENTKHIICSPAPIFPFIQALTPFSLASFLQPSPLDLARCNLYKQMHALRQSQQVTVEEYAKAISSGTLIPLLKQNFVSEEETIKRASLPHDDTPGSSQTSKLEQMMEEAEKRAKQFDEILRVSATASHSVIHPTHPESR